jgi:hypothetical protein
VAVPDEVTEKRMRLRYAGRCRLCGTPLEARTEAVYERDSKTVRCVACPSPPQPKSQELDVAGAVVETPPPDTQAEPAPESGTAGASARREFERRQARREERIRTKHPKLGGLILALSDDPQSTTTWNSGALGEERLGQGLDACASDTVRLLHDRRIPGTRANIDHLAVTPAGVLVIDAKRYVGQRPALVVEGGLLRPRIEKLKVGSRDQTKLVDGVLKQVELVAGLVGDALPVRGCLCFIEADWPLIGGAFTVRRVDVLWPKRLYPRLAAAGPFESSVAEAHALLAAALPPA